MARTFADRLPGIRYQRLATPNPPDGDYVVGGVLYCSKQCVRLAGEDARCARKIEPGEYDQSKYGACCPVCESEYHGFG